MKTSNSLELKVLAQYRIFLKEQEIDRLNFLIQKAADMYKTEIILSFRVV